MQQYVHEGQSSVISTHTWVPQGCLLSLLLFTLHTNQDSCTMIKYADDVALIELFTDDERTEFKHKEN